MPSVCLYFKVHQPYRVRRYSIFDIGSQTEYFSEPESGERRDNQAILKKVSRKCYDPTNALLLKMLKKHPEFRLSFSLSGVFIDQLEQFAPETLDSFKRLVATGRVEILSETFYHSLAFLKSEREFKDQVRLQNRQLRRVFGVKPRLFSNTEAAYNNYIGRVVSDLGYEGLLTEGADRILGWRSPNFLYHPPGLPKFALLLKNYRLSDDIAFRFSDRSWRDWPLNTDKFTKWIEDINGNGQIVNLFMDFETFGEHQWADTGIFDFLEHLPTALLKARDTNFVTPSEALKRYQPVAQLDIPDYVTWADTERDLTAWQENPMQQTALDTIYNLERAVRRSGSAEFLDTWRRLQTSDHFYYMCTKWFADGDVHKYFNPYDSPYEAYISYMNVVTDFKQRLVKNANSPRPKRPPSKKEAGSLMTNSK